ncbi:MAG: HD domain-containing phosphohydrolase [Halanaerobiales bacterium]|nr:HD domain-containing phosphohydrolase [Halanaerobiales bacterium]
MRQTKNGEKNVEIKKLGNLPNSEMRLSELFITLSSALDMGNFEILDHSRRVAYIALEIGGLLELEAEELNQLVLAALVHDVGIVDYENKAKAKKVFQIDLELAESHCKLGSELIEKLTFMPDLADIIHYHHHKWNGKNFNLVRKSKIPLASRIIHLADRIESLIKPATFILNQVEGISREINAKSGSWFDPELVKIFSALAQKESFWLNLKVKEYNNILERWGQKTRTNINLSDLESLASIVAHLIDRVSPFTSRHSSGVATIAAMLTNDLGYSLEEQRAVRIAGLFHDLGKLIVPNEIIEKRGELTELEYRVVKQHTFYTYTLLDKIEGLGSIPQWAGFHHERLDGTGYPFRIQGKDLNMGSRIMAVSDVFQALTEDRPYRSAFSIAKAVEIIDEMQQELKLDADVISVLKNAV